LTINLNESTAGTRENRLGSITGYSGDLYDLASGDYGLGNQTGDTGPLRH